MALTRRFFTSYARDMKDIRPPAEATQLVAVWAHCVTVAANHFALNNAMFNREKFYDACGFVDAWRDVPLPV